MLTDGACACVHMHNAFHKFHRLLFLFYHVEHCGGMTARNATSNELTEKMDACRETYLAEHVYEQREMLLEEGIRLDMLPRGARSPRRCGFLANISFFFVCAVCKLMRRRNSFTLSH